MSREDRRRLRREVGSGEQPVGCRRNAFTLARRADRNSGVPAAVGGAAMTVDPGQMRPQAQATFRRTPVHHRVLSEARAGVLVWLPEAGLSGAPGRLTGRGRARMTEPLELIAFFELRRAGLVVVEGSVVSVTSWGGQALARWAVIR